MTRAYSEDLRIRVVRDVEAGSSRRSAAFKYAVSISFVIKLVQRWRARSRRAGRVAARSMHWNDTPNWWSGCWRRSATSR